MFGNSSVIVRGVHKQVADRIGLSIVRGDILVGEALPSEMQLCEMINVSRTVVREAIRTLTGKGLVEARAKSGTRVRPPERWNQLDPDVLRWQLETSDVDTYLAKLFRLRCAVEPSAAAIAAIEAKKDDIARIRAGCDGMDAAQNNEEFVVADIAFHQAIFFATRNEFFWPIAQMFEISLRKSFTIAARGDHRARALREHRDVLNAIVARNPDAAHRAASILLERATKDIAKIRGGEVSQRSTNGVQKAPAIVRPKRVASKKKA